MEEITCKELLSFNKQAILILQLVLLKSKL